MKIINKVTGKTVATIEANHSMTLDEAINLVGEIHAENEEENVKIGDDWYYYDDLGMEWRGGKRANSGRKPTGRKMRSIRLTDSEYAQVKDYINAGREDAVAMMTKMEVTEQYGESNAYSGGTVVITTQKGYSYTYIASIMLGEKTESLYITSEVNNLSQPQAYWTRTRDKVKGYLPAALTIDDINKAADLLK